MAYEQAFHTCCRNGLTTPGLSFQFNAASPGLDETMLAAIGRVMTGYTPPPSAPPAPTPEDLRAFPISLRYARVEGVGSCVSRTVYVGREDRSDPDGGQGRFGNYFSHVLALPSGESFANGVHPIELWEAPFWTAGEAGGTALAPLADLSAPGAVAGRALPLLDDPRLAGWLPTLFDGLAAALEDRSRVVVLDMPERSWAWVAAAVKCLPRSMSAELTFDTYDGEPDRSNARLCVSVPDVSRAGLLRGVHTGDIVLVDPLGDGEAPVAPTLLGRAVGAWLERGAMGELPRIAQAADALAGTLDAARYAAVLTIAAEDVAAVRLEDVDALLAEAGAWLDSPPGPPVEPGASGRLLGLLAADESMAPALATSARSRDLLAAALQSPSPDAESVSTALLTATLACADDVDAATLPRLPEDGVSFEVLGAALELVSPDRLPAAAVAHRVRVLHVLGLLGHNGEVDRRAGAACGRYLASDDVVELVAELSGDARGARTANHALWALAIASQRGLEVPEPLLRTLGSGPLAARLERLSGPGERFPAALLAAKAAAVTRPQERRERLAKLLELTDSAAVPEAVAAVYPTRRERTPAEAREILEAHAAARRSPARELIQDAWATLAAASPFETDDSLLGVLRSLSGEHRFPADVGIEMARSFPARTSELPAWIAKLGRVMDVLPPAHADALVAKVAREAVRIKGFREHRSVAVPGLQAGGESFERIYARELERALRDRGSASRAVNVLMAWESQHVPGPLAAAMVERVLPDAMRHLSPSVRDDIRKKFDEIDPGWGTWFEEWDERHPPAGRVGRVASKLGLGRKR